MNDKIETQEQIYGKGRYIYSSGGEQGRTDDLAYAKRISTCEVIDTHNNPLLLNGDTEMNESNQVTPIAEVNELIQELAVEAQQSHHQLIQAEIKNQQQILSEIKQARDDIKLIADHIKDQNELSKAMSDADISVEEMLIFIKQMTKHDICMDDMADIFKLLRTRDVDDIREAVDFFTEHDKNEVEEILEMVDRHGGIDELVEIAEVVEGRKKDEVKDILECVNEYGQIRDVLKQLQAFVEIKNIVIEVQ